MLASLPSVIGEFQASKRSYTSSLHTQKSGHVLRTPEVDLWSSYSQAHIHIAFSHPHVQVHTQIQVIGERLKNMKKSRSGLEVLLGFEAGKSTLGVQPDKIISNFNLQKP